ncbi:MAG: hypothetical protein ABH950_07140 [Candidatus Altiarchaeota archaeon]
MGLATTWMNMGLIILIILAFTALAINSHSLNVEKSSALKEHFRVLEAQLRSEITVTDYSPTAVEVWAYNSGATKEKTTCMDVYLNGTYLSNSNYSVTLQNDSFDPLHWNPGESAKFVLDGPGTFNTNANLVVTFCNGNSITTNLSQRWAQCYDMDLAESDGVARVNDPVVVNLTNLDVENCSEVRIINNSCNQYGFEVPYKVVGTDDLTWCEVVFLADASASGTTTFSVYHNYTGAPERNYPWDLLLYLPFNESDGTIAYDKSGYGTNFTFEDEGGMGFLLPVRRLPHTRRDRRLPHRS